jgi:hypothetical protein
MLYLFYWRFLFLCSIVLWRFLWCLIGLDQFGKSVNRSDSPFKLTLSLS